MTTEEWAKFRIESERNWYEIRAWCDAEKGPMPRYSGPTSCPKCASTSVGTRYCTSFDADCRRAHHIHRDCARCGHKWCEAPLDATADAAT